MKLCKKAAEHAALACNRQPVGAEGGQSGFGLGVVQAFGRGLQIGQHRVARLGVPGGTVLFLRGVLHGWISCGQDGPPSIARPA
ncbi:hypothetical protein D3C87_2004050 [compost metagenome]